MPSAGDNRKAAEDQPLPQEQLLSAPFPLEALQIPPRRASKKEEPGKKEEPYGRDSLGDSVTVGQQPSIWAGRPKNIGSVRPRDWSGIPGFVTRAGDGCVYAARCRVRTART